MTKRKQMFHARYSRLDERTVRRWRELGLTLGVAVYGVTGGPLAVLAQEAGGAAAAHFVGARGARELARTVLQPVRAAPPAPGEEKKTPPQPAGEDVKVMPAEGGQGPAPSGEEKQRAKEGEKPAADPSSGEGKTVPPAPDGDQPAPLKEGEKPAADPAPTVDPPAPRPQDQPPGSEPGRTNVSPPAPAGAGAHEVGSGGAPPMPAGQPGGAGTPPAPNGAEPAPAPDPSTLNPIPSPPPPASDPAAEANSKGESGMPSPTPEAGALLGSDPAPLPTAGAPAREGSAPVLPDAREGERKAQGAKSSGEKIEEPKPLTPLQERRLRQVQEAPVLEAPTLTEARFKPWNGFTTGSLWNRGPLGFADFSLGLSAGDGPVLNNVSINTGMRFTNSLGAHLTAAYRNGNYDFSASSLIQEGYLDLHGVERMGGGPFQAGLRFGKVQNLVFSPGPLTIFDQMPLWKGSRLDEVPGYGEIVPYFDWQSNWGFGFSFASQASFLGDQTGLDPIHGYMRLRADTPDGYLMELRGGWMPQRSFLKLNHFPGTPRAGTSLYVGKQWRGGIGLGIVAEQLIDEPFRIGAALNLPMGSSTTQGLGNFLGGYRSRHDALVAHVPLARLTLGEQQGAPPEGAQLVGSVRSKRIYRTEGRIGASQYPVNGEFELSRQGITEGPGIVRTVSEGPRALSGFGSLVAPSGGTLYNQQFEQEVVYNYYRVVPFSDTWLEGKVYDKDNPQRTIRNLTVQFKSPKEQRKLAPPDGQFKVQHPLMPGKRERVQVVVSAPGYVPETIEARLIPGETAQVEIPLRPLRSGVVGRLIDADTGRPIPEVEVLLGAEGAQPAVVLTGRDGEFRMADVEPGTYAFASHAPRYYDERMEVTIPPGQTHRLEIKLRPRAASIAGRVLSALDQPVAGARVLVTGPGGMSQEMTSLEDGSFGATGLRGGQYALTLVTADGQRIARTLNLTAGEITPADLKLR